MSLIVRRVPFARAPLQFCSALLITMAVLASITIDASAQSRRPPLRPIFGIGDDEFYIGGWNVTKPGTTGHDSYDTMLTHIDDVWKLFNYYHISVMRLPQYFNGGFPEAIIGAADGDRRVILSGVGEPLNGALLGREVSMSLIPDSFPRYHHVRNGYTQLLSDSAGGRTELNPITTQRDDWNNREVERVFHRDTVAPNTEVARGLVFNWNPDQTSRYSRYDASCGWTNVDERHVQKGRLWEFGQDDGKPMHYVVVRGHLFENGGSAPDTAAILRLDFVYEVSQGQYFYWADSSLDSEGGNGYETCMTLYVRK